MDFPIEPEFNALPEGHTRPQMRRTKFGSGREEKEAGDAANLRWVAAEISERVGESIDPLKLLRRRDDDVARMGLAFGNLGKPDHNPSRLETTETDPRLQAYFEQYYKLRPEIKARCVWAKLKVRLLAYNGAQLERVKGLNGEGILFGIDQNGKALFADKAKDPRNLPHCGLGYTDSREAVMFKREGDKKVATGYELFPVGRSEDELSEEVLMFKEIRGFDFMKSESDPQERVMSWLECGEASWPKYIGSNPKNEKKEVEWDDPDRKNPLRGVRRLLRV